MRVIFLDMDGVLSSIRGWLTRPDDDLPDRWIDTVSVKLLNLICAETGAIIVVSSTWRLNERRDNFLAMMRRNGFTGEIHEDWRTVDLFVADRGVAIKPKKVPTDHSEMCAFFDHRRDDLRLDGRCQSQVAA